MGCFPHKGPRITEERGGMKITRALLLSSQNQAEAWEREPGYILFASSAPKIYRFLVSKIGGKLFFQIYCVHQEVAALDSLRHQMQDVIAAKPHVEIEFEDMGRLINFLHRYQINVDNCWQPVETRTEVEAT
jgi:hypothetical protein